MRAIFAKAAKKHAKKGRKTAGTVLSALGGLGMLGSAALIPGPSSAEMQISDMLTFRENATSTCVPFDNNVSTRENYVQYEANLFKHALNKSRTFREIAAQGADAGLNINHICHAGDQFRPSRLDLETASLTVNLLREDMNRPYEALLATHYLYRMKTAELNGAARNPEFTPGAQLKAYMVQFADAVAWTGLAAAETALENGRGTGPEFEIFKKRFPGAAQAVADVLAEMPRDGADHYDHMKQDILTAGFTAAMDDDLSRSWVANNGLPKWLERHMMEHPEAAKSAGTRGYTVTDIESYGSYMDALDPDAMYEQRYGNLENDPAAEGLAQMQRLLERIDETPGQKARRKTPANTPANTP